MNKLILLLFFFPVLIDSKRHLSETKLRNKLFKNYSKIDRPVLNFSSNVKLKYGIEVKSLEYFDQKAENIKFNLWLTQLWNDEYLKWDKTEFNSEYININSYQIWLPDLELYNSASQPNVYDAHGGLRLYSNGDILWVRPTTYSFSCKLNLKDFPFDKQKCTMTFGSWKYNSNFLDVRPFNGSLSYSNISIDKDFSHNEWSIINKYVTHQDIEYLCCPGELWPNSFYTIVLQRNYTKYMVVITMTLLIALASMTLITFSVRNYTRTFVLVFLPLPVIWLQIYISSKIPVIEYYTYMERVLLTCFVVTIINAFESAILYCLLFEKFEFLSNFFQKKVYRFSKTHDSKIILDSKNNNSDTFNNFSKCIYTIDLYYKIIIISIFIIILILL